MCVSHFFFTAEVHLVSTKCSPNPSNNQIRFGINPSRSLKSIKITAEIWKKTPAPMHSLALYCRPVEMSASASSSSAAAEELSGSASDESESPSPAAKKLRSQPRDLVVAVGSGTKMKEFQCYRLLLSLSSDYFDVMLSTNMRENEQSRIEFADKDPNEWIKFYAFIDPETSRETKVTRKNVKSLLPWFHEFQMAKFVKECDDVLAKDDLLKNYNCEFHFDITEKSRDERRKDLDKIFKRLSLSQMYGLPKAKKMAIASLADVIKHGCDIIDMSAVEQLMLLIKKDDAKDIWNATKAFLPKGLRNSNCERHLNDALFPHLLYASMHKRVLQRRVRYLEEKLGEA